jgi:hypothetical protein
LLDTRNREVMVRLDPSTDPQSQVQLLVYHSPSAISVKAPMRKLTYRELGVVDHILVQIILHLHRDFLAQVITDRFCDF